ncbi:MAG: cyclic nucleotide-binding domain-containing protein [Acidimicrobiia bacterium]
MANKDSTIAVLRAVPALQGCRDRQLARVARLVDEIEVEAGRVLMREGTPAGETFLIVEGEAAVALRGRVIATIGPGQFVGEMAMFEHGPRSATVTATTPMRLLVFGAREFASLLNEPGIGYQIAIQIAHRLRSAERARRL